MGKKTRLGGIFTCILFHVALGLVFGGGIGALVGSWKIGAILFGSWGVITGVGYYFDEDSEEEFPWDIPSGAS